MPTMSLPAGTSAVNNDAGSITTNSSTPSGDATGEDKPSTKPKIRRSRRGCHTCKRMKIKCDEQKPLCLYCVKTCVRCDYLMKLTWGGRPYKKATKKTAASLGPLSGAHASRGEALVFVQSDPGSSPRRKRQDMAISDSQDTLFLDLLMQPTPMSAESTDSARLKRRKREGQVKKEAPETPSILDVDPGLSHGIDSVSDTLDKLSGSHNFGLRNLEIFANFVSSLDVTTPEMQFEGLSTPHLAERRPSLSTDDYYVDLEQIGASIEPRTPSNLLNEFLLPPFSGPSRPRITEIDDSEPENALETVPFLHLPTAADTNPLDAFLSVPPQFTPLPEILLQVPYYRNLMHFWVNVASENLVPAPLHIYQDNPFKVLLPQMAMHYPSILTTILAFAASSRAALTDTEAANKEVIDRLLARSCTELLRLLKDKTEATSDGTLATVLLLLCYEYLNASNTEKHRAHAIGARQIIMARENASLPQSQESPDLEKSPQSSVSSISSESNIAFFLMRWFVYVDVLGALLATSESDKYLNSYSANSSYTPLGSVATLGALDDSSAATDPRADIDYLLGFDVRFLPQFIDTVLLIRTTDAFLAEPGASEQALPVSIITKALEVKERLTRTYEQGEMRRQANLDKLIDDRLNAGRFLPRRNLNSLLQQDSILRCTNKLYCDMGFLNLYRRVLRLPRDSELVQNVANGIADILEHNLELQSSAEVCTIFCLFCAGCETLDERRRQLFRHRFEKLIEMGNINARKSFGIMTRCWETGEDWITAARAMGLDIVLM